jgi:hypothetical protein
MTSKLVWYLHHPERWRGNEWGTYLLVDKVFVVSLDAKVALDLLDLGSLVEDIAVDSQLIDT